MEFMTPWIAMGAAGGLALLVGVVFRIRSRRKSAAERERERRLAVNATGRITDGVLVELDRSEEIETTSGLLFYRYKAKGIEYSAAQDISGLLHLTPPKFCSPGVPVQVKYNPQRPSDSIILCEQWSGLPAGERQSGIGNRAS
ncbi:MAG: DUF3592 domain-containing protein [Terriglobia bacterium]